MPEPEPGPDFLDVNDVLMIHRNTLEQEGGLDGVRDWGMLESAVAMPRQQFGGQLLHPDLAAMAAAYLFHLALNHPFLDGNKRTATMTAYVFLNENGCTRFPDPDSWEQVAIAVASGQMTKPELIDWMRDQINANL